MFSWSAGLFRAAKTAKRSVAGKATGFLPRKRRRPGWGSIERLESRELLTVTYHGGAELPKVEAQAVYLGSSWNSNSTLKTEAAATDQFLATIVQSPYMDMLANAGYNVGRGSATAGVFDNVALSSASALTDSQIRTDLQTLISNSQVQSPDANRLYVVYVEPQIAVQNGSATSTNSFLGYHGAFAGKTASGAAVDVHYAVLPAPGTPNPTSASQGFSSDFNELTSVTSHELAEAVTDPNVNYKALGWYDDQLNGEIGDLAQGHDSTIAGANGPQYVVQDVVNQNDQIITPITTPSSPAPTGVTAPTLTVSAASTTVAQLSWTAVSGTQGYRVYQVNGAQSTLLGTVSSSSTSVQVSGLTAGATESFKVEAYNSTNVADSQVVSVTMPSTAVPTTVTIPQLTVHAASSTSAVLSWNLETQAQGYRIYWSNGYQVVYLGAVGASTDSVTITGLSPSSTSYFRVEAFNATSYADSAWVAVSTPSSAVAVESAQAPNSSHHLQHIAGGPDGAPTAPASTTAFRPIR